MYNYFSSYLCIVISKRRQQMVKSFLNVFSICLIVLFSTSCSHTTTTGDKAVLDSAQQVAELSGRVFSIDQSVSSIAWLATHRGGLLPRYGTIGLLEGSLSVKNKEITAGSFTFDISTIKVNSISTDSSSDKASDLEKHLKNEDFFNIERYPNAKFEITSVKDYDSAVLVTQMDSATNIVSGNLTIKDSTINITFPAKIDITKKSVLVNAKFKIDRTLWGLNYKAQGDPKDWAISRDLEMTLHLIFKK